MKDITIVYKIIHNKRYFSILHSKQKESIIFHTANVYSLDASMMLGIIPVSIDYYCCRPPMVCQRMVILKIEAANNCLRWSEKSEKMYILDTICLKMHVCHRTQKLAS